MPHAHQRNRTDSRDIQQSGARADVFRRIGVKLRGRTYRRRSFDVVNIVGCNWFRLCVALARQGKYEEAENDFREVITTEQTALGPEHPATLGSRAGLSNVLTSQGKYAEAEAECRQLIPLQEKVFGPEHPSTLDTCYTLAYGLAQQGKLLDAKIFARRAADAASKVLGANHPMAQKYAKFLQDLRAR